MKNILLIFFIFITQLSSAQDCYSSFLQEGIAAYSLLDFERAINQFKAAKICDDLPAGNDIDEWISKSQTGYIDAIKKARQEAEAALARANSLYLANLSKQALEAGELIIAFRLMESAYQKDKNPVTQELIIDFQQKYDALFSNTTEYLLLRRFNGNYISQTKDDRVHIHDGSLGKIVRTLQSETGDEFINTLVISPKNNQLATISRTGQVRLWDGAGELLQTVEGKSNQIEFSKDGTYLLSLREDQTVELISGWVRIPSQMPGFSNKIVRATFSPDNQYLMGVSIDGVCKVFDLKLGILIVDQNVGIGEILDASFSPNSQQVIFISAEDKILLVDINLSEDSRQVIIPVIKKVPESIDRVITSEDGKYILVLLKGQSEFGGVLYDKKGEIIRKLKHADLEWTMVTINMEEAILVFRINNEVHLRKLEKHSFRESILNHFNNKMRPLSQEEKLRFGIAE
ncbi:MAG: hypothetical protein ACI8VT_003762 [Saprospiraceae bacterium]|jgi:hypothetical protein